MTKPNPEISGHEGHTETPWGINTWNASQHGFIAIERVMPAPAGSSQRVVQWIAKVLYDKEFHGQAVADAEFIVKCVNSHEALLEAAKKAFRELNEIRARDGVPYTHYGKSSVDPNYFSSVVDELQQVICLAEKKS